MPQDGHDGDDRGVGVAAVGAAAVGAAAVGSARPAASARRRVWLVGWVLLAVAAGFAGWSGWWYWQGGHTGAAAAGRLRDQVLRAATQEIADLNTVSDKRIGTWQARWLADTTGPEHAQVERTNAAARAQIERVETSSTATVTGAAVTRLNQRAGTARVIAVVQVRQSADSGGADTVSNRYLAGLTLVGNVWKISSITPG